MYGIKLVTAEIALWNEAKTPTKEVHNNMCITD
jgi:hypothetical protein